MECVNCRLKMLPYLKEELDAKMVKKLLMHVTDCPDCKEELRIQFLVMEGMKRLEYGKTFNLEEEFEESISQSLKKCHVQSAFQGVISGLFYGGCLLVIFFLIRGIIL